MAILGGFMVIWGGVMVIWGGVMVIWGVVMVTTTALRSVYGYWIMPLWLCLVWQHDDLVACWHLIREEMNKTELLCLHGYLVASANIYIPSQLTIWVQEYEVLIIFIVLLFWLNYSQLYFINTYIIYFTHFNYLFIFNWNRYF